MEPVQVHLILNHVPVIGCLLATAILAFGLLRKQEELIRLSLYLLMGSALAALPVYFSGEGAEEAIEHLPGVLESIIEPHEDLAKVAIFLVEAMGLAAIGALVISFKKERLPLWAAGILLLLGLINGAVLIQTAHLGGQIRHTEIREGAKPGQVLPEAEPLQESEKNRVKNK